MAIAPVQASDAQIVDGASGSTTLTLDASPTAGNLLTVGIAHYVSGSSSCSVSDNKGGTWTRAVRELDGGGGQSAEIWYRQNVASSSGSFIITLTFGTGSDNYAAWAAQEWSGIEATALKTTGAAENGFATSVSITTSGGTTPAAGDLVLAGVCSFQGDAANGYTAPSGFTELWVQQDSSNHQGGIGVWQAAASAGHQTVTISGANALVRGGVVAVFAASAGGSNGSATGATVTATTSVTGGGATGQRSETASGTTLTATASVVPGSAAGVRNATAAGGTLTTTASLTAGSATGQVNGTGLGATLTAAASLVPGTASGVRNGTATGATLSVVASLLAGTASGTLSGSASGATASIAALLLAGTAAGQSNGDATGATLAVAASLIPGGASAGSTGDAPGATVAVTMGLTAGSATGVRNVTADGQTLSVTASLSAGGASGQVGAVAAGTTVTAMLSVLGGGATGQISAVAAGAILPVEVTLTPGGAVADGDAIANGQTIEVQASLLVGAAIGGISSEAFGATLYVAASVVSGGAVGSLSGIAAGATLPLAFSLVGSGANGQRNATAAGQTVAMTAGLMPGSATGTASQTAGGAVLELQAQLVPGGAFALGAGVAEQARVRSSKPVRDKDVPEVPVNLDPALRDMLERLRESVQRLQGNRGDPGRSAVLWDDLGEAGLANAARHRITLGGALGGVALPGGGGGGGGATTPDLTPPPTPTGLAAVAGFSNVLIEWDAPVYLQGHGHKQTNVYATKQGGSDATLYTINDAVKVDTAPGALTMRALPSDTFIKWRIWIKWESVDGVESPPAGGINGFVITTGQIGQADVSDLVIEARHLADGAIDLSTGKVTADGEFGAIAVGYTVTQYLLARAGLLEHLVVDDAQVANLSAAKLTVGDGTVGGNLKSANYSNALRLGWIVQPNGYVEFNNAVIRGSTYTGTIFANAGTIGGSTLGENYIQSTNWVNLATGWQLKNDGTGQIGGIAFLVDRVQSGNFVSGEQGFMLGANGMFELNAPGGWIRSQMIGDEAVTSAKIKDLAVDTLKIAQDAVTVPDFSEVFPSGVKTVVNHSSRVRYEFRWADTGGLLTLAELEAASPGSDMYFWRTRPNPWVTNVVNRGYYTLIDSGSYRDYGGQPVLMLPEYTIVYGPNNPGAPGTAYYHNYVIDVLRVPDGSLSMETVETQLIYFHRSTGDYAPISEYPEYEGGIVGFETGAHVVATLPVTRSISVFGYTCTMTSAGLSMHFDMPPTGRFKYVLALRDVSNGGSYYPSINIFNSSIKHLSLGVKR